MPNQNIWVFYDRRTNPATVHRFTRFTNVGEPQAVVINILRDPSVDASPFTESSEGDFAEGKASKATRPTAQVRVDQVVLSQPDGPCVTHLPLDFREADWWGPNGEYLGPRGILYVGEHEYNDPHSVLAEAERKRLAAPGSAGDGGSVSSDAGGSNV